MSYDNIAKKLFTKKILDRNKNFIDKKAVHLYVQDMFEILYPHFSKSHIHTMQDLSIFIKKQELKLEQILKNLVSDKRSRLISKKFTGQIPVISDLLDMDAHAIFKGDPAAKGPDEIIFTYPGFFATLSYRIANFFFKSSIPILPRMITEYAHQLTGIDIHPGATIGRSFCIDHGTGVVIGETTIIGNSVKIYQGVTLGALSVVGRSSVGKKRHPTIEDNCVIYSNATILGGDTTIGKNSIIGGNMWVVKSVPANSILYRNNTGSDIKHISKK